MTDVVHQLEPDGGNLAYHAGQAVMGGGFENVVLYSLFGGNQEDSGQQDGEPFQWWGNLGEDLPERTYRSRTQHLLQGLPATSGNLGRIEDAAKADLEWLTDGGWATFIRIEVSIPALNRIRIEVLGEVNGEQFRFEWTGGWGDVEQVSATPAASLAAGILDFSDPANSHWIILF